MRPLPSLPPPEVGSYKAVYEPNGHASAASGRPHPGPIRGQGPHGLPRAGRRPAQGLGRSGTGGPAQGRGRLQGRAHAWLADPRKPDCLQLPQQNGPSPQPSGRSQAAAAPCKERTGATAGRASPVRAGPRGLPSDVRRAALSGPARPVDVRAAGWPHEGPSARQEVSGGGAGPPRAREVAGEVMAVEAALGSRTGVLSRPSPAPSARSGSGWACQQREALVLASLDNISS